MESKLKNMIDEHMDEFFRLLVKNDCNMDFDTLKSFWTSSVLKSPSSSQKATTSAKTKPSVKKTEKKPEKKSIDKSNKSCPYVFQRGEKKGERCSGTLVAGSGHCKLHKKYDTKTEKPEKSVSTSSTKSQKIFSLNRETGKYFHNDTMFAIESKDEPLVIGKLNKTTNKIEKLTEEDVEKCKEIGLPIKKQEEEDDDEFDIEDELKNSDDESFTTEDVVNKAIGLDD